MKFILIDLTCIQIVSLIYPNFKGQLHQVIINIYFCYNMSMRFMDLDQ